MPRSILSPEAKQDLRDIRQYYLEQAGARVTKHVLGEIDRAIKFLADNPGAGHSRSDLTNAPVRFWQVFTYFLIYDSLASPIQIVRVLHARRDLAALLRA